LPGGSRGLGDVYKRQRNPALRPSQRLRLGGKRRTASLVAPKAMATITVLSLIDPGRSGPLGVAFSGGEFGRFDVCQPLDLLPFRGRSRGLSYASRRRDYSS
jgi:hypothetical protein